MMVHVWYFMIMPYSKAYRRSKQKRPVVAWKDKTAGKPAPFVQHAKFPMFQEVPEIPSEYVEHLIVGTMWMMIRDAALSREIDCNSEAPIACFFWSRDVQAPLPKNSPLIYAGVVRAQEQTSSGKIIQVPRHAFIAHSGRVIIRELAHYVKPVQEQK